MKCFCSHVHGQHVQQRMAFQPRHIIVGRLDSQTDRECSLSHHPSTKICQHGTFLLLIICIQCSMAQHRSIIVWVHGAHELHQMSSLSMHLVATTSLPRLGQTAHRIHQDPFATFGLLRVTTLCPVHVRKETSIVVALVRHTTSHTYLLSLSL